MMIKCRIVSHITAASMPLLLLALFSFGMLCNGKTLIAQPTMLIKSPTKEAMIATTTTKLPTAARTTTSTSTATATATSRPVENPKQLAFNGPQGKETNTPNFVRLVVMRLIYGLASTMGLEDRLEGTLNGIFVPPNADDGDFFGGGGGGGDAADAIDLFGGGGGGGDDLLEGLFDADY